MKISAQQIHDGKGWLPAGSALLVSDQGTIESILPETDSETTMYDGVLCPGFVNVHCHLELSHMKGRIPEHTGLVPFLKTVSLQRNEHTEEEKKTARKQAFQEMVNNGIVAVGDIANSTDTLDLRALDQLHFHTFVEALGFSEVNAARSFGFALKTFGTYKEQASRVKLLTQSITPHAPYSVSAPLFRAIDAHEPSGLLSIHNQESEAENQYYYSKEGNIRDLLGSLGIDDGFFVPSGLTSLKTYLEWLSPGKVYIFVHNTFTSVEDVQYVKSRLRAAHWCLCPNANLYIENRLPDINMLRHEQVDLCIGTDSLASNHQLSILSELISIRKQYPNIAWEELLKWGTHNGATALQMQDKLGTIEPGKQPGILQITQLEGNSPAVSRII